MSKSHVHHHNKVIMLSNVFSQGDQPGDDYGLLHIPDAFWIISRFFPEIMWYNGYGVSPIAAELEQIALIRWFGHARRLMVDVTACVISRGDRYSTGLRVP